MRCAPHAMQAVPAARLFCVLFALCKGRPHRGPEACCDSAVCMVAVQPNPHSLELQELMPRRTWAHAFHQQPHLFLLPAALAVEKQWHDCHDLSLIPRTALSHWHALWTQRQVATTGCMVPRHVLMRLDLQVALRVLSGPQKASSQKQEHSVVKCPGQPFGLGEHLASSSVLDHPGNAALALWRARARISWPPVFPRRWNVCGRRVSFQAAAAIYWLRGLVARQHTAWASWAQNQVLRCARTPGQRAFDFLSNSSSDPEVYMLASQSPAVSASFGFLHRSVGALAGALQRSSLWGHAAPAN